MMHVVVIGGGASGVLAAVQLLLRGGEVSLVEPAAELGRGLAYSSRYATHLLNVPAGNMSALGRDADHFLRWLQRTRPGVYGPCSFVPRWIYGEYVHAVLTEAREIAPGRFQHVRARAVSAELSSGKPIVRTDQADALTGDAIILATGNAPPGAWPGLEPEMAGCGQFFNSAWIPGALDAGDCSAAVLLLGSGLTAVDAVLALRHNGHRGMIHMVSRRGLLPQIHVLPVECRTRYIPGAGLRVHMHGMRAAAAQSTSLPAGWRQSVDSMRPDTNRCWQALTVADQRRFLRHVRPYWDTHRHRMAPEIGAMVNQMLREGNLRVMAGRVQSFCVRADGLEACIAMRGGVETETLRAGRVINCTGADGDLTRSTSPLLRDLVAQGWIQPDPQRLGALVDERGTLLSKRRGAQAPFYTLGPLRLGKLIESVAIPEIRVQAQELAELLSPLG